MLTREGENKIFVSGIRVNKYEKKKYMDQSGNHIG